MNLKLKKAHGFYGIITLSTIIGLSINFVGVDPIKLLVYTSVLNGVVAVPLIFLIIRISRDRLVMGEHVSGKLSVAFTWLALGIMAAAALGALLALLRAR